MALYAYTLQPIPCKLTEAEMQQAQAELFNQTNAISMRTWIILGIIAAIGIAGVVYFSGGSSVFFWLLLVGVGLFFVFKFVGLPWYMRREMAKQPIPPEIKGIKLGLQPHGLVMSMPNQMAMQQMQQRMGGSKQGKSMMTMMKGKQMGGDIPWSAMTEWKETPNFYMVMFEVKGQQGSQIIPKRMKADNFPIDNMVKHLKEHVKKS